MRLFTIDAGTKACGWAFFDEWDLVESGLVTDEGEPFDRCASIARTMFYLVSSHQPDRVVIEYPHKGGPGMKSKSITILFHFCGMLHAYMNHINVPVEFVQPMTWKGQVPKDKHQPKLLKKMKAKFDIDGKDYAEDTIDAIGLGIWEIWEKPVDETPPEDS